MESTSRQKLSELSKEAFELLLDRLDSDRAQAGEKYEHLRRKLVQFFRWERTDFPEENADEVLNRVARKLRSGEEIGDLQKYVYGVARMIALEAAQKRRKNQAALAEMAHTRIPDPISEEEELLVPALWDCLQSLPPDARELILKYYHGERQVRIRNRKTLAGELGIPLNALRNRALRLREKLQDCVEQRRKEKK